MAQTASNAVYSKPKATGCVWSATPGSALPTDASTELDPAFEGWGYISDDGISLAVAAPEEGLKEEDVALLTASTRATTSLPTA